MRKILAFSLSLLVALLSSCNKQPQQSEQPIVPASLKSSERMDFNYPIASALGFHTWNLSVDVPVDQRYEVLMCYKDPDGKENTMNGSLFFNGKRAPRFGSPLEITAAIEDSIGNKDELQKFGYSVRSAGSDSRYISSRCRLMGKPLTNFRHTIYFYEPKIDSKGRIPLMVGSTEGTMRGRPTLENFDSYPYAVYLVVRPKPE